MGKYDTHICIISYVCNLRKPSIALVISMLLRSHWHDWMSKTRTQCQVLLKLYVFNCKFTNMYASLKLSDSLSQTSSWWHMASLTDTTVTKSESDQKSNCFLTNRDLSLVYLNNEGGIGYWLFIFKFWEACRRHFPVVEPGTWVSCVGRDKEKTAPFLFRIAAKGGTGFMRESPFCVGFYLCSDFLWARVKIGEVTRL